jgi:hypothetical protein
VELFAKLDDLLETTETSFLEKEDLRRKLHLEKRHREREGESHETVRRDNLKRILALEETLKTREADLDASSLVSLPKVTFIMLTICVASLVHIWAGRIDRRSTEEVQSQLEASLLRVSRLEKDLAESFEQISRLENEQSGCDLSTTPQASYDCIMKFQSLSNFAEGGSMQFLQAVGTKLDITNTMALRVISVVGLPDTGKTFLISTLFNRRLPSSRVCVTHGLSCLYIEEYNVLVIDSPAVQATVSHCNGGANELVDAQITEAFLHELIARVSDNIVFVVNKFTWSRNIFSSSTRR